MFERLSPSEGLIVSRTGSGSFVSATAEAQKTARAGLVAKRTAATTRLADLIEEASPKILPARWPHPQKPRAFITGLPDYDAFPLAVWSRRLRPSIGGSRATRIIGYSDPNGLGSLRQAIAEHLAAPAASIACDAEQIFIVNGAQRQAFDLIGRVLRQSRATRCRFENPGAIGARCSFMACGQAAIRCRSTRRPVGRMLG